MEQPIISSDLIRGHIDTIILYSLESSDKYAQQISDFIEEKSDYKYKINQATLYSSLKRLETLKYVKSYLNDADESGRRKFFHLTDFGKVVIKDNQSNWSFSRDIIDKLIGSTSNATSVVYITKPVDIEEKINDINISKPVISTMPQSQQENIISKDINLDASNTLNQPNHSTSDNYKIILSNIIAEVQPAKPKNIEKEDLVSISTNSNSKDIEQFSEVLEKNVSKNQQLFRKENIDFTDIIKNSKLEGYKIKISSKNSALPASKSKVPLINLLSSLSVLVLFLTQFFIIKSIFNENVIISQKIYVIATILSLIHPIVCLTLLLKRKQPSKKYINGDSIFTACIIAFNFLLIIFAIAFLFELDFKNIQHLIYFIIIPIILITDMVIYYTLRYLYSKIKKFQYSV